MFIHISPGPLPARGLFSRRLPPGSGQLTVCLLLLALLRPPHPLLPGRPISWLILHLPPLSILSFLSFPRPRPSPVPEEGPICWAWRLRDTQPLLGPLPAQELSVGAAAQGANTQIPQCPDAGLRLVFSLSRSVCPVALVVGTSGLQAWSFVLLPGGLPLLQRAAWLPPIWA